MEKKIIRSIIRVFAIVPVLWSCTKTDPANQPAADELAVNFGVTASEVLTRGVQTTTGSIIGTASSSGAGIGVFAFYQPSDEGFPVDFSTYRFSKPNFMCNQKVETVVPGNPGTWTYTPMKYWPNNTGDQLSFFAYAPYSARMTWTSMGISTDAAGTFIKTSVRIYDRKADMKDLLWADPVLNVDKTRREVSFKFRHLLSQVSVQMGVNTEGPAGPQPWTDPNTVITIDSIVFTSLADKYDFFSTIPLSEDPEDRKEAWQAGNSTHDVILEKLDFNANAVISTTTYATDEYQPLLSDEGGSKGFLFLTPQSFSGQTVSIIYSVKTKNPSDPSKTIVTRNVVTREMREILPSGLETGKAYVLKFLLIPGSADFNGGETDWAAGLTHKMMLSF